MINLFKSFGVSTFRVERSLLRTHTTAHPRLTLAIINAKIWTPQRNQQEDQYLVHSAIGIADDLIINLGDDKTILGNSDNKTTIIDAKGRLLLPGFTDSHCHFLDGGHRLLSVRLRSVTSPEEFTERIATAVSLKQPGEWILGGDWDHHSFGGILPTKQWLDKISPVNPVWLNRMDGHMFIANSCAMKLAGIDRNTPDIDGGTIVRDDNGEPTGLLKDNATNLVIPFIPKHSMEFNQKALDAAMSYVASMGVTKVHTMVTVDCACGLWPKNLGKDAEHQDMDVAYEELEVYSKAHREGRLKTRIRAALPLASWKRLLDTVMQGKIKEGPQKDLYYRQDHWLQVGSLKVSNIIVILLLIQV